MKFSLPKAKKQSQDVSVGLDIGRGYIKGVVLRKEAGIISLDNFCSHNVTGNIPNLLKKITAECNFPTHKVNISLSGKSTIVRDLWMPQMKAEELKASLGFELDQYIPFPAEEIYYDSYILPESPLTRKNGQMRVVLAVAKKGFVNEHIQWLKDAGLVPNIICVDAISLSNVFQRHIPDAGTLGLIDIGSSKSIVDIISNNLLTFTREVEYGTARVRDDVSRGLSVSIDEAEKLICSGDQRISGWVEDFTSRLAKEVWSSFEYYEGQEQRAVEKVYITGGGALLPGLAGILNQSVGLPVEVWSPLDKMKVSDAKRHEIHKTAPLFTIAVGMGYRSL